MTGAPLGEIIYSAVKPMIRMYMIIGTGFFLTRKGLFGVTTARACSDMVLMLFMPALVFDKIVSYISISDIKTIGVICFSAVIMYGMNACIALLVIKFTPVPKTPKDRWVGGALLGGIMQNVSDLPIAYIQAVSVFTVAEQNKGTAYVIIWLAMYVVTQFNCGLYQLVEWDFSFTEEYYHGTNKDLEQNEHDDTSSNTFNEKELDGSNNSNNETDIQNNKFVKKNSLNLPEIHTSPTNQSYSSDTPLSQVSSIDSEDSTDENSGEGVIEHHRIGSANLDPRPLTLITSKISQLSRASKTNAIARIPSARNPNYNYPSEDSNRNPADDVLSLNQELVREYSHVEPYNKKMTKTMRIITETNLSKKDIEKAGSEISFVKKYHLHYLIFFLENFKKPNSVSLLISIPIALIPWTKALFVSTGEVTLPNAPDNQPPLSFILMYAEYLGYPCVPLGLLLIGSVLGRLEFDNIPKGFWKSAVCNTIYRLAILPIIGTAFITRMKNIGWLTDPMSMFVCTMEFALPSATVQIYLTAAAMKPGDKTCTPLNCFGLYLAMQYVILVVSMPIVVCYCVKNTLEM